MKTLRGAKILVVLVGLSLVLGFTVSKAYCWAGATHAYIDDQLQAKRGWQNLGEMYGGMAPDVFNFLFGEMYQYRDYLYAQTHEEFMDLWQAANSGDCPLNKPLAYGFVSHNDLWGADATAHHNGRTFGQSNGYVIEKALILKPFLIPVLAGLGIPEAYQDAIAQEFAHNFVEFAVDILVRRLDPQVGRKMTASALLRSPTFPALLVEVYGADFANNQLGGDKAAAAMIITSAERAFRRVVILEGQALMQDEPTAVLLLSEQLAELALGYLSSFGIILPPGALDTSIVASLLTNAMTLCEGDFAKEIKATIKYVDRELDSQGISY